MRSPGIALVAGVVLACGGVGYGQGTCSARCPDGSQSEIFNCNDSSYVPMCLRAPTGGSGGSAPAAAAPAGMTAQQQMATAVAMKGAYALGQSLHKKLFDKPQLTVPIDPAAQQRQFAAQQLNNSGLAMLRMKPPAIDGAIKEFQKALAQTPNDGVIQRNLQIAQQLKKNTQVARSNSDILDKALDKTKNNANAERPVPVNPHGNLLQDIVTSQDGNTVDLSHATRTTPNPQLLQGQIDNVFAKRPMVEPPVPSQWPGPERSANDPKLTPSEQEQQNKAKLDTLFSNPAPPGPHN